MLGIILDEFEKCVLLPSLRIQNFDAMPSSFSEHVFQKIAILESHWCMDKARQILGIKVKLFQKRRQKFGRIELLQVLPIKITAVHHATAAKMEEIHGHLGRLRV